MRYIELLRNQFLWHPRGKPWGNDDRSEWRNLIDALPQLVWTATPDGACDYFQSMDGVHRRPGARVAQLALGGGAAPGRPGTHTTILERFGGGAPSLRCGIPCPPTRRLYGWFKTRGVPIRDREGTISKWFGSCTDITELQKAREALRASEERWRTLTETLPQLVWTATPDGACDYFSNQWTEYTGVPERELLGWLWVEVLHRPRIWDRE